MDNEKIKATIHGETREFYIVEDAVLNKETGETVGDYGSEHDKTSNKALIIAVFLLTISCLLIMSWSVLNVG